MDKTPDVAQLSTCCGKPLVWASTATESGEVDGWGGRCPGCGMEWQVLPRPARLLLPTEQMLLARIAELEATLANERGEGEPPVAGWTPEFHSEGRFWKSPKMITALLADGWHWSRRRGMEPRGVAPTARDAMRAASEAPDVR